MHYENTELFNQNQYKLLLPYTILRLYNPGLRVDYLILDKFAILPARAFYNSHLICKININQPEPGMVALCPLKIIGETPYKIAFHLYTFCFSSFYPDYTLFDIFTPVCILNLLIVNYIMESRSVFSNYEWHTR